MGGCVGGGGSPPHEEAKVLEEAKVPRACAKHILEQWPSVSKEPALLKSAIQASLHHGGKVANLSAHKSKRTPRRGGEGFAHRMLNQ